MNNEAYQRNIKLCGVAACDMGIGMTNTQIDNSPSGIGGKHKVTCEEWSQFAERLPNPQP